MMPDVVYIILMVIVGSGFVWAVDRFVTLRNQRHAEERQQRIAAGWIPRGEYPRMIYEELVAIRALLERDRNERS